MPDLLTSVWCVLFSPFLLEQPCLLQSAPPFDHNPQPVLSPTTTKCREVATDLSSGNANAPKRQKESVTQRTTDDHNWKKLRDRTECQLKRLETSGDERPQGMAEHTKQRETDVGSQVLSGSIVQLGSRRRRPTQQAMMNGILRKRSGSRKKCWKGTRGSSQRSTPNGNVAAAISTR